MLIATDPLSLVFIACFLFGLLFLIGSALLGNLGHGGGSHAASHQFNLHVGGHASTAHTVGHVSSTHGTSHAPGPAGHAVGTHQASSQGNNLGLFGYVNPTSIVLFLLGFGFFGYVFHNTTHLVLPLTLTLAGVGGIVIAAILLVLMSRLLSDSETDTVRDVSDRTGLLGKVSITIQENSLGEIIYS